MKALDALAVIWLAIGCGLALFVAMFTDAPTTSLLSTAVMNYAYFVIFLSGPALA